MTALARVVLRHRRAVVAAWVVLTLFGAYAAGAVSSRWLEQFSIPGYSAYESNQRALKIFGTGAQAPHVAVFTARGDVTRTPGLERAIAGLRADFPRYRVGSWYSTRSDAYVSRDRHTMFATIYPPGRPGFSADTKTDEIRASLRSQTPPGVQVHLTGRDAIYESEGGDNNGPSVLTEALIGGVGALVIL